MNDLELKMVLENHKLWMANRRSGQGKVADFKGTHCGDLYFGEADLTEASLKDATFEHAYFKGAKLKHAYLSDANFDDADFTGANFDGAFFFDGCTFQGADFECASFKGTCLNGVNFHGAENILTISGLGSKNRTTYFVSHKVDIMVRCGCFWGNITEFRERVVKTYQDSKEAQEYLLVADLACLRLLGHK